MREIVDISCGQGGNQISSQFWQMLIDEHGLNQNLTYNGDSDLQLERINVYFNQQDNGSFLPRAVMIDLEPGTLDSIKFVKIFSPDNFVQGQLGTGNNWAKGYYSEGSELIDQALDVIRKEAEGCDLLEGFQMTHSLGGGTGSGMGALVIQKLRDEYPDNIIQTFSIVPSFEESVTEPYNTTLAMNQLIDLSNGSIIFDNSSIAQSQISPQISQAMSDITCSFRFPSKLNETMRKMTMNLSPYQRLHFYMTSVAPLTSREQYRALTDPEICSSIFDTRNMMCMTNTNKWIAGFGTFRGRRGHFSEIHYQIQQGLKKSQFIDWIPDNFKYQLFDVPPKGLKQNGSLIVNSTGITEMFKKIAGQFSSLFRRKAFLHWYINEGMDEMEFIDAESAILDLINEYQQYQDASITEDEGEQSEGEY